MKILMTINTIELSSKCDLACRYCINRLMKENGREPEIMSGEVFEKALGWLQELVDQGTQQEVNLNGNGESTLDPDLPARASMVVDIVGDRQVSFCTNGVSMTMALAKELKAAGIKRVDLSVHNAFYTRMATDILLEVGILGTINGGAIAAPHNWARQIDPRYQVKAVRPIPCNPLIEGRGYVQSNGNLSPCCYDYRGLGTFGTVFDQDLLDRPIRPYELCASCHQFVPEEVACT
jgi:hypothetical protein